MFHDNDYRSHNDNDEKHDTNSAIHYYFIDTIFAASTSTAMTTLALIIIIAFFAIWKLLTWKFVSVEAYTMFIMFFTST